MNPNLRTGALILASAFAPVVAGGAGQTAPTFAKSAFCQKYQCKLLSTETVAPGLTEQRYFLNAVVSNDPRTVVSTFMRGGQVVGAQYVTGTQDAFFAWNLGKPEPEMFAELVKTVTGKRPTPQFSKASKTNAAAFTAPRSPPKFPARPAGLAASSRRSSARLTAVGRPVCPCVFTAELTFS